MTQIRRLRGRIHRQGRNHAIFVRHADRDVLAAEARSRCRLHFRSLRSGFFRRGGCFRRLFHRFSRRIQAVHRVNDRLRRNRRACHRVNAFTQRQRRALADELRRERFFRALLTQTRRLRGRIHRQGGNHTVFVRHVHRDFVAIVARSRCRLNFRSLHSGFFRRSRCFRRLFHGFSRCIQAVHRVYDRLRRNRRACHRVDAFAQRQRRALADELARERFIRALLTQTRRLAGRIHHQCRNHTVLVCHLHRDVRAAEARNRRGLRVFQHSRFFRRGRGFRRHRFEILRRHRGRSQRRIDGLHRCRRGDGRAGQPIHIFIQGKRAALADELRRELFVRAARAEAGRLRGSVDNQRRNRAIIIQRQARRHFAVAKANSLALMHVACQLNRLRRLFFLHAERQHVAFDVLAQHMADALQHIIGCRQHRLGGDGRAGNRFDGVAAERAQTNERLRTSRFFPTCAEAVRLGKVRVANLAADDFAIHINAQRHSDIAAVALGGGHRAVADGLAVLLRFHQRCNIAAIRNAHGAEGIRLHDALERRVLRRFLVRLDGTRRNRIRHRQQQRRRQRNQRQNQVRRKLFPSCLGFTHGLLPPPENYEKVKLKADTIFKGK